MRENSYRGKKVLITGGLGFIGSNIAHRMVELGADVNIMDSRVERLGANDFNIAEIRDNVNLDNGDIRDLMDVKKNVEGKDIIFNLAAQVDYKWGNQHPDVDAAINLNGHQNILETVRRINPRCRIVFPGSRTQYVRVNDSNLPVKEECPLETSNPPSFYTANKTHIETLYKLYNKEHGLDTVVLRLTNPFGPRAQIKNQNYCVLNWFIAQALQGNPLTVFGDGNQLRDYIYIDDVIDAFVIVGIHPEPKSRVYNIGSGKGISFWQMTQSIARLTGASVVSIPYPDDQKGFETGHFYADISKARKELGWEPKTDFSEGLRKTVEFYRQYLTKYI